LKKIKENEMAGDRRQEIDMIGVEVKKMSSQ